MKQINNLKLFVLYKLIIQKNENNELVKITSVNYKEFVEKIVTNLYILTNIVMNDSDIKESIHMVKNILNTFENEGMITINVENNKIFINYNNVNIIQLNQQFMYMENHIKNTYKTLLNYDEISMELLHKFCNLSITSTNTSNNTSLSEILCEEEEEEEEESEDELEIVTSSDGMNQYVVNKSRWTCSCPAFRYSRYKEPRCKHVNEVYLRVGNKEDDTYKEILRSVSGKDI